MSEEKPKGGQYLLDMDKKEHKDAIEEALRFCCEEDRYTHQKIACALSALRLCAGWIPVKEVSEMPRQNIELDRRDCGDIAKYLYNMAAVSNPDEEKDMDRCEELARLFDESDSGKLYQSGAAARLGWG